MERLNILNPNVACRQGQTSTSGRIDLGRSSTRRKPSLRGYAVVRNDAIGEVTLLDYGAGNVRSVRNAIKKLGYNLKEVTLVTGPCYQWSCLSVLSMGASSSCKTPITLTNKQANMDSTWVPCRSPQLLTYLAQNGSSSLGWEPLSRQWESSPGRISSIPSESTSRSSSANAHMLISPCMLPLHAG